MNTTRVLIIDDEPAFTDAVKINLELTGRYRVETLNDPITAIEKAREIRPDVIVLDIVMPEKDGGDLLTEFEKDPILKQVPVVVLTALVSNLETSGDAVAQSGGEVMLAKPVTTEKLIHTIESRIAGVI